MNESFAKKESEGLEQFVREVFPAELEEIRARRARVTDAWAAQGIEKAAARLDEIQAQQALGEEMNQAFEARQEVSTGQKLSWWMQQRLRGLFAKEQGSQPAMEPSTSYELAGLAFSGGGVRSATFNLGVVQAISEADALSRFDYLSTVSGGGYIGSCLSSVLNSKDKEGKPTVEAGGRGFPLNFEDAGKDSPALRSLRTKSSKYLAPADFFESLRMGALVARGFLLNLVLFLPYVVFCALAIHFLMGGHLNTLFNEPDKPDLGRVFVNSPVAMAMILGLILIWKPMEGAWAWWKERPANALDPLAQALAWAWKPLALGLAAASAGVILIEALGALVLQYGFLHLEMEKQVDDWLVGRGGGGWQGWIKFVAAWLIAIAPIWLKPLLGFAPLAAVWKLSQVKQPWSRRLSILALGSIPALVSLVLVLELAAGFSLGLWPNVPAFFTEGGAAEALGALFRGEFSFGLTPGGLVALWLGLMAVNAFCVFTGRSFWGISILRFLIAFFGTFVGIWLLAWVGKAFQAAFLEDVPFRVPEMLAAFMEALENLGPLALARNALSALAWPFLGLALLAWGLTRWNWIPPQARAFAPKLMGPAVLVWAALGLLCAFQAALPPAPTPLWGRLDPMTYYYFMGAALLWYLVFQLVDVNSTSLHSLYRDALARAYLFTVDVDGTPQPNTHQKLSGLNDPQAAPSPYHLINAAANLQASKAESLNGRSTDFFTFSKRFVGGPHTGYRETKAVEALDPALDLGTALAISGAAASPNMGTQTIRPLVPFLTMLNLRLGYWAPSPRRSAYRLMARALAPRFAKVGYAYLLKEMTSLLDETRLYVNVSDGGHIENLGLYELLRRRCKLIVASDAEADPQMGFHGLAQALRYASIDQRVEVEELDLAPLARDESGLSKAHAAFAKIIYGKGTKREETGYLIYLKSSFSGKEGLVVGEYRSLHPEFPHESTADQFFDEAQFEAYRALGYHIGKTVFKKETPPQASLEDWWKALKQGAAA